jgi:hypothetical protein
LPAKFDHPSKRPAAKMQILVESICATAHNVRAWDAGGAQGEASPATWLQRAVFHFCHLAFTGLPWSLGLVNVAHQNQRATRAAIAAAENLRGNARNQFTST